PSSFSFRLLGGSRLVVSAMDTYVYVKLLLPPRQSRGISHLISSVWEDDGLFEIAICAANGKFCGEARCYTTRQEMTKLSLAIGGFPKSTADEVHFSTYSSDRLSYFSVHFFCVDGSGHVLVRVKVADIVACHNARSDNNLAEFDLAVEPAAIDTFSSELARLAGANIGDVTAVLKGSGN
ncbi:MAG: hypothetical protein PHS32_00990, partial [Rhodoferax sp.]|uniref:hypothetical protein n=1 Tax=Rhodoferax sp. TaxID=50421 RepID=UPI002622B009